MNARDSGRHMEISFDREGLNKKERERGKDILFTDSQ